MSARPKNIGESHLDIKEKDTKENRKSLIPGGRGGPRGASDALIIGWVGGGGGGGGLVG